MKNQNSFTPGPWETAEHGKKPGNTSVEVQTENGLPVAIMSFCGSAPANAALIAAAPDLLNALESALSEMDAFQKYWTSPKMGMKRGTSQAQEQARAAIAKAKGDA